MVAVVTGRSWRKYPLHKLTGADFSFEGIGFLFLAVLSIATSGVVTQVEAGRDPGGIVGWGIAEVFRSTIGPTAGFLLLVGLLLLCVAVAFNVFPKLEKVVQTQVRDLSMVEETFDRQKEPVQPSAAESTKIRQPEEETRPEARTTWLPPEFRKSFTTPDVADETSDSILERSPELPPLDLLNKGESFKPDKRSINMTAGLIEKTLAEFGIPAKVVGFRSGPTVTQFAVEPGYIDKADDDRQKIRVSQISSLQRDLALALSAERLRIEAPVPGKSYVGIEIPNPTSFDVQLRPLLETDSFSRINSQLALALGRDVSGRAVISDLATMPHLLIAGTTGSGKSVYHCADSLFGDE